jgi:hypothetical protein
MRTLSVSELLEVWERGLSHPPSDWALMVLCASCPEASWESQARMSIGRRDARLLKLREQTFGPKLQGLCDCPRCGERMEMTLDVADILLDGQTEAEEMQPLTLQGYEVRCRLPNSLDLAAVARAGDKSAARKTLFRRCIVAARCRNEQVHPDELPASITDAVEERIALADAQADIRLDLTCPGCDYSWQSAFDIVTFFRDELSAWAQRLLRDVHTLAAAYGWSEDAIVALSAPRRQAYLEMITG